MVLHGKLNHTKIYYYGLLLLAISLPLSIYFTSVAEIILLVNWIVEGNLMRKLRKLKSRPSVLLIMGLYFLHIIGAFHTDAGNMDYLLQDLKIKLPLLLLPLIIGTSEPLNAKQLKAVLLFFCLATLSSTLISFAIFLGIIPYEYYDFREISIFISHIRLALMVNLSVFILLYYIFHPKVENRFGTMLSITGILAIAWLIFFLVLLKSLTGLIILGILVLVLGWIYSGKIEDVAPRFIIRTLIVVVPLLVASFLTRSIGRFYYREKVDFDHLKAFTPAGNPYFHDTTRVAAENGYYVWLYISEKELRESWNRISEFPYDSLDRKGQRMKYTLIRYLTSKGLRKDADGVMELSSEDVKAIENGLANHIFLNKYSLYPRVYEVIWEIDGYLRGRDPSGHSVAQRIAYLEAAKSIFLNDPLFGVGTGDVQSSFNEYYERSGSKLDMDYRRRAHNQYVTFLITFGIVGLIFSLIFLFGPIFLEKKWNSYLFMVFFFIAFLSMLNEDTLETQTGVSFFIYFYSLFLFGRKNSKEEGS